MPKTPAIMFQGTCSNAGKSVLTAALCRILLQDGMRVAPFKAQNMSLNSFVTRDGGEMGRAQVVQAQAALLDPDVRMNPILLKPSSDTGSQVILLGKPVGNMTVNDYLAYKPQAFLAVQAAYDSLASEYEVMVLEGAGSPAEVNLKAHDIVNMPMARYAEAKVLLVGDIDRGGVFASFVGTMEILDQWERELIAGYIVNRFRGQKSLLDDALEYMEKRTGKPVLGVVDYLKNLGLPEEDSVNFKAGLFSPHRPAGEHVTLALIDLPHISNFTDFEPFLAEPDLFVKIARTPADLAEVDGVILPGSKNVIGDLKWLFGSGLAEALKKYSNKGREIVGICGGFQMLGTSIEDPHHIESAGETLAGLGLLDLATVLEKDKTLVRQSGTHLASSLAVHGYEIHHGQSRANRTCDTLTFRNGESGGVGNPSQTIWGTYLHGIFDADPFRRWFIDRLRERRGLPPLKKVQAAYDLEPAFDRLAEAVRSQIDMNAIYRLLGK
ncbi:cobyric acid synthase [Thiovibrio frasassiensis]|uniref:Cobyric acid synthase n=1 Tax=Thiovibrio frasassiensis TaxID=2984131 RepID=A0A9X4MFW2_9BACT|nr:cobyric acid synthase [Thiovibrio frasassiensis]MDG4475887.1 cobyric acid synthase [Thiovibrio frasassiensis]